MGDLVKQLSEQTSNLVRAEVELAKVELSEKGKRAGIGLGAFGAAGIVGLFAFGAFTAAAIMLLATAVEGWIAALIVFAVYAVLAGVLALTGRNQVQQATPPAPERTVANAQQDVQKIKTSAKEGRA
ncbi:phage holin family protein [Thermoleophilia bacterium SCSIO 60948]|nr:phage holin family protein [Thermoleophilia bacterium SCSIO 60948]